MVQSAFLCKCTVGAALVSAALMMVALVAFRVYLFPGKEEDRTRCTSTPVPSLVASAGHGEATLKWNLPEGHWPHIKYWQYEQAERPNAAGTPHNTGTTATTHVVPGLTNGVRYYFRIRAVFEHGVHRCWSNSASATPTQPGNVLKEMATRQKQIATRQQQMATQQKKMATHQRQMANRQGEMADQQRAMTRLQGEMARAHEEIATTTRAIARDVAANRATLKDFGERNVVGGETERLGAELARLAASMNPLVESVGALGDKVANGLAGIERRLIERPPTLPPELCEGKIIGKVYFDHDSHEITDNGAAIDSRAAMSEMAAVLKKLPGRAVVLAVGYANAVGTARHNLHLSDLRAACTTYCLRQRLGNRGDGFRFRELAKGEEIDASDPTGTSAESRRVDVKVCRGPVSPEWPVPAEWEGAAETCHCP